MTIGCNIWMICLILIWFFYSMFQFPQFVWALRSLVWDVFINFLLIDATDRSKISSDLKRFFIAYTPFNFSRTLPLISNLMGRFIYHVSKLIIIKFKKKFRQGYNLKYTWSSLKLKIFKNMKQTLDSIGVIRWSIVWSLEIYIHFT